MHLIMTARDFLPCREFRESESPPELNKETFIVGAFVRVSIWTESVIVIPIARFWINFANN